MSSRFPARFLRLAFLAALPLFACPHPATAFEELFDYLTVSRSGEGGRVRYHFTGRQEETEFPAILEILRKVAEVDASLKVLFLLPPDDEMRVRDLFGEIAQIHATGLTNVLVGTLWESGTPEDPGTVSVREFQVLPWRAWDAEALREREEPPPPVLPESPGTDPMGPSVGGNP